MWPKQELVKFSWRSEFLRSFCIVIYDFFNHQQLYCEVLCIRQVAVSFTAEV